MMSISREIFQVSIFRQTDINHATTADLISRNICQLKVKFGFFHTSRTEKLKILVSTKKYCVKLTVFRVKNLRRNVNPHFQT